MMRRVFIIKKSALLAGKKSLLAILLAAEL